MILVSQSIDTSQYCGGCTFQVNYKFVCRKGKLAEISTGTSANVLECNDQATIDVSCPAGAGGTSGSVVLACGRCPAGC